MEYKRWLSQCKNGLPNTALIGVKDFPWLPVDLRIDSNALYKMNRHPLFLYFRNSYDKERNEWLPINVYANGPRFLFIGNLNIKRSDVDRICLFINDFKDLMIKVANKEMSVAELLDAVPSCWEPLLERELFVHHQVDKFQTWFHVNICFDDDQYYKTENHPLWLYFRNGYTEECDEWLKIIVTDQGACLSEIKSEIKINECDFTDLCHFVDNHHEEIRQLADGEIFYSQFIETIKAS